MVLFSSFSFISYAKKFMSTPVSYNPFHSSALFYIKRLKTKVLSDWTSGCDYYYIRIKKIPQFSECVRKLSSTLRRTTHNQRKKNKFYCTTPIKTIFDWRIGMTVKWPCWDKFSKLEASFWAQYLTKLLDKFIAVSENNQIPTVLNRVLGRKIKGFNLRQSYLHFDLRHSCLFCPMLHRLCSSEHMGNQIFQRNCLPLLFNQGSIKHK